MESGVIHIYRSKTFCLKGLYHKINRFLKKVGRPIAENGKWWTNEQL